MEANPSESDTATMEAPPAPPVATEGVAIPPPVETPQESVQNPSEATPPQYTCPLHEDPYDAVKGWARPRKFGEYRFAKVILLAGLFAGLLVIHDMYLMRGKDPAGGKDFTAIHQLVEHLKDLTKQWIEGTNVPSVDPNPSNAP